MLAEFAMLVQTNSNPSQTSTSSPTAGYLIWTVLGIVLAVVILIFIRVNMRRVENAKCDAFKARKPAD